MLYRLSEVRVYLCSDNTKWIPKWRGHVFLREEFGKRTIIQLRWALIISIGYIAVFSNPGTPFPILIDVFFPLYVLTNLILSFGLESWFQRQKFIFLILLVDLSMTALIIFVVGPKDSEFYVTFFLILLISAITRKALLVYSTFSIILTVYGVTSYLKAPQTFFETASLLRFPFIFILALFFRGIVVSYNRIYQEKELLKEDYRELEVLNEVALSIGQDKDLSRFLYKLSKLLSEMLGLGRCTAIIMDNMEDNCYMVSSDDSPEMESRGIDVRNFPTLKESLKSEDLSADEAFPLTLEPSSRYILKKIPIAFKGKKLGTLYLRANTPKRSLTHREEYFLQILGRITALAIMDLERSMVFDKIMDDPTDWKPENAKATHLY